MRQLPSPDKEVTQAWLAQNNRIIELELKELSAQRQPLDATLTALAAADWVANSFPIGSGADTVAQVAFAANTFPARASTGNLVAKPITDYGLSLVDDTDAATARATLGLGTMATQNANAVAITGGTIDGTPIGATTASAGTFTTVNVAGAIAYGNWNTTVAGNAYLALQSSGATYGLIGSGSALIGGGAATELALRSGADMLFSASGSVERMRLTTTGLGVTGSIKSSHATAGVGYATGAGGAVTQITNKATGVTLDKASGEITMHNAALAAGATVLFTLNNTTLVRGDAVIIHPQGGYAATGTYEVRAELISGGACVVVVKNVSAGSLSEAVRLNYIVIKGVAA